MSSPMAVRLHIRECILDLDPGRDGITDPRPPLPVHASLGLDLTQDSAYFRLRATLSQPLADLPDPHGRHIYLEISPEQLTSFSYCRLPDLPEKMQQRPLPIDLSSNAGLQRSPCMRLVFHAQSAVVIIPPQSKLEDISIHMDFEEDRRVFQTFRSMSKQSSLVLVLYSTELPSALTVDHLDRLCSAVSSHALKSNLVLDSQRLYSGQGCTIIAPNDPVRYDNGTIDAEDVAGPAGSPPESPPSYEQADPPPPLAPFSPEPRSMKRARTSTPSTESAGPVIDVQSLELIIQRAISSAEARFKQELSRQKDAMAATEARLQEDLCREISALREELVAHIDGKLVEYMTGPEIEAHLDEQLDLKSADLVTGAELEEHVNDFLEQQNEELVTRTEMEDFVEDRLETTSQKLRDRIFEAFDGQ